MTFRIKAIFQRNDRYEGVRWIHSPAEAITSSFL
jgi:hypothetical protein